MTRYPALIDGETGAYGVTFPDLPGFAAMGEILEEAVLNAEKALRDAVVKASGPCGYDVAKHYRRYSHFDRTVTDVGGTETIYRLTN